MDDMDFGGDDLDMGGDSGSMDAGSSVDSCADMGDFADDTGSADANLSNDSGGDFNVTMDDNSTSIDTEPDTIANLENQGYGVEMEVTEPDADFSNPTSSSSYTTDSDDIPEDTDTENQNIENDNATESVAENDVDNEIPEDTQSGNNELSDADREWLDNRDEEREKWTDGEVPQEVTDDNLENSTYNPDAESMTLGKYGDGGEDSYINQAGNDSTYYSSENYEGIQDEYHQSDKEMYESGGNKDFIENNLDEGKDVQFSHDPREDDGALGEEWDTIQEKTGANDNDLAEGEDGMLHLENKGTYVDEQPLDKHEDEEWN